MMCTITKEEIVAYKSLRHYVAKLKIPVGSRTNIGRKGVVDPDHAKFRCDKARVLEIRHKHTNRRVHSARSIHDPTFRYIVGKDVEPRGIYNTDPNNVCAPGIHFFLTKKAAHDYDHVIKNGLYQQYDDNGNLERMGMIENNQRQREWITYHKNGKLFISENYINGKRSGLCKEWDEDEFLKRIKIYKEDYPIKSIFYQEDKRSFVFTSYDDNKRSTISIKFRYATILNITEKMDHENQLLNSGNLVLSGYYGRSNYNRY